MLPIVTSSLPASHDILARVQFGLDKIEKAVDWVGEMNVVEGNVVGSEGQ